jgi:hypothetical protein
MVVNATPDHFTPKNDPVLYPLYKRLGGHLGRTGRVGTWAGPGGWAPGPDRAGAENFALAKIGFTDRPAHKESQYRLSYRGPHTQRKAFKHFTFMVPCIVLTYVCY